jgi:hypothetical protein
VLPLDLGRSEIAVTPKRVVLSGTIREGKVVWDYSVKLTDEDFLNFGAMAERPEVLDYLARHNGVRLLGTLGIGTVRFFGALVGAALGLGTPIVPEDRVEDGSRKVEKARGGNGVLVKGSR